MFGLAIGIFAFITFVLLDNIIVAQRSNCNTSPGFCFIAAAVIGFLAEAGLWLVCR